MMIHIAFPIPDFVILQSNSRVGDGQQCRVQVGWHAELVRMSARRVGRLTRLAREAYVTGLTLEMDMNGTVKFFNTAKGFGFIEPDEGGKDVFVHASALEAAGIRSLMEGDRVSFIVEDDRRGRGKQAAQLKKI